MISDLILIIGSKRQYWSQNANETNTDTVKIGEGITILSTKYSTKFKADANGTRITDKDNDSNVKAEFTDKGIITEELIVKGQAEINVLLIQEIDSQAWLTGLGG